MAKRDETKTESAKQPYQAPVVTRRESLAEVTAVKKKLSPSQKETPCWVARAVYGEDNPRWLLFRAWLLDDAPAWLRAVYLRFGRSFARVVARQRWLAGALRALMDRAIAAKFGAH